MNEVKKLPGTKEKTVLQINIDGAKREIDQLYYEADKLIYMAQQCAHSKERNDVIRMAYEKLNQANAMEKMMHILGVDGDEIDESADN